MESSGVEPASLLYSLLLFRSNTKRKNAEGCEKVQRAGNRGFFFQISPLLMSPGHFSPQLLLLFAAWSSPRHHLSLPVAPSSQEKKKRRSCKKSFRQKQTLKNVQPSRAGRDPQPSHCCHPGVTCSEASTVPIPRWTRCQSPNSVTVRTKSLAWSVATLKAC